MKNASLCERLEIDKKMQHERLRYWKAL